MVGPGGRVLGFEPQRLIFQLACGNAALNGCRNASLLHCGLGAEPGVARMNPVNYADEFNFGSLAIAEDATGEPVQIRTLDEVIKSGRTEPRRFHEDRCPVVRIVRVERWGGDYQSL
jgi:FkbM family methyltransferase